jgi:hypothetical protein
MTEAARSVVPAGIENHFVPSCLRAFVPSCLGPALPHRPDHQLTDRALVHHQLVHPTRLPQVARLRPSIERWTDIRPGTVGIERPRTPIHPTPQRRIPIPPPPGGSQVAPSAPAGTRNGSSTPRTGAIPRRTGLITPRIASNTRRIASIPRRIASITRRIATIPWRTGKNTPHIRTSGRRGCRMIAPPPG